MISDDNNRNNFVKIKDQGNKTSMNKKVDQNKSNNYVFPENLNDNEIIYDNS